MNIGMQEIIALLFLVLLTGAAALIVLMVIKSRKAGTNLKPCPFCAESIQRQATVCRYCSKDVPA